MAGILEISLRTLIGFLILLVLTRLLGKKQLGQLTIFTYITAIAMGNIAGDMVVHNDIRLLEGITSLVLWAALTFLVEYLSLKSSLARVALDGEPAIVIKRGVIMQKVLASQRLNMDDLTMLLRINNVFSIAEVDYAILEPNGQLSVLKKPEFSGVIRRDMGAAAPGMAKIPTEVIVDGKLVEKNLRELNITPAWLQGELEKAGIRSVREVFFAELQADDTLYISRRQ